MKKWRILPIGMVFLLLSGCGGSASPEPLYIGQLLPSSGPDRLQGEETKLGSRLAVAEAFDVNVRYQGRVLGVRHIDDRHDREVVRAETTRLLAVNRVPALLGMLDPELSEAFVRTAAPSGIVALVPGDVPELPQGDAIFPFGSSPAYRGRVLARFAATEFKAKKAAVLIDNKDPIAGSLAMGFLAEWRGAVERTTIEGSFDRAASGQEALLPLSELLRSKPDVILLAVEPKAFGLLCQEATRVDSQLPLLYGGADIGQSSVGRNSKASDVYYATIYCAEALTERGKQFAEKYEKEMHAPPDLAAAQAYDGTRLLIEAIAKVGIAAAPLRDHLLGLEQWETVTGPLSLKDRRPKRPVFLMKLKDGKAQRVREFPREE